ncbi:MAG TPA: DNA polymerase I [Thermomicrobiales bacterium]|nr:DNA polymerase I [Thermomicrobiales bacterium]
MGKSFRHDEFEDYKAHRAPMPDEMRGQVHRIRELIGALDIPVYEADGFEADDVIGTLARQANEQGIDALLLTGDSDLLQLVNDHTTVILPGAQRFGEYRVFDRDAVVQRYGFGPERLPEFKALVGDKSDNIPGVPGIGEKTAKSLIETYPSIEEILAHTDEITPARARNALAENGDLALRCRRLATIVRDVPVELDIDRSVVNDFDREAVLDLFRSLGFRTLMSRVPESHRAPAAPANDSRAGQIATPEIAATRAELESLASAIKTAGEISVDVETDATNPITANLVGIAVATAEDRAWYVPLKARDATVASIEDVQETIGPAIAEHPNIVTHHGKFDLTVMLQAELPEFRIAFDTMLAAYLLGESGIGLKDLAFRYLGWEMTEITELIGTGRNQITMDEAPLADVVKYAGADVESTIRLRPILQTELEARDQMSLLTDIELPLVPVLVEMERVGIAVDVAVLEDLAESMAAQIEQLEERIYSLVGHEFNLGSTRQMATVLFDELGLPSGRRTKTGYSVGQEVLEGLRGAHEVIDLILEHRTLKKIKSTYVDTLPQQVDPRTGRIHTTFNQTIAATGRLSSIDPNLQNIPIRSPLGREVRRAFVAATDDRSRLFDESSVLYSADYSQVELRIMAHFSQDKSLLEAFNNGIDVHRATAAQVFNVPIEDVTPDMRATAKTVNFGIMYGMQAYGLSRDTGMSRQDATQFIERYMKQFDGVRSYLEGTLAEAQKNGYVKSLYGRRRYVPDIAGSGPRRLAAERAALNMPLQATAADIMKIAMIDVARELERSSLRARMLLQVHDELVFETPESEVEPLRELVSTTMRDAAKLSVPLDVESSVGRNWGDMVDLD